MLKQNLFLRQLFEYSPSEPDGLNVSRPKPDKKCEPERKSPFKKNTYLDLSGHHLLQFTAAQYSHLCDIRYLYLKNNKLKCLDPDLFKVFPELIWLDVRNNELTTFPDTVTYSPNLSTILLENNNLHELPVEIGSLKCLKSVMLRGNPLLSPLREIIETGPKKTSEYLRNKWYEVSGDQPPSETVINDGGRRDSIRNLRRKLSRGDAEKSFESSSSMWSVEIRQAMEEQERYIQKKRDIETLKDWRNKQSALPRIGSKHAPPFELDERYLKIMSRDDINKPRSRSPTRSRPHKKSDVKNDLEDIEKSLLEIRCTSFKLPDNADELEKLKFTKVAEISKIKELQKRLEDLKMKH